MDIKQGQTLLIGWLQMHGIPCRERFVIVEILYFSPPQYWLILDQN